MTRVRWIRPGMTRIVAGYVWCRENDWVVDIDRSFVPELLTVEGFELVEPDDLTQIEGISSAMAAELVLVLGVSSYGDLADADPMEVSEACGVALEMAEEWRDRADGLAQDAEIGAAMARGCCG